MAAIIGAAPTVLIAYLLEFRYYRSLIGLRNLSTIAKFMGYGGSLTTAIAGLAATTALTTDAMTFWYRLAMYTFTFGLGAMFGLGAYTTFMHKEPEAE